MVDRTCYVECAMCYSVQDFSKQNKNRKKGQGLLKNGLGSSGQTYWGTRDVIRKHPRPLVSTVENVQECVRDDPAYEEAVALDPFVCQTVKDRTLFLSSVLRDCVLSSVLFLNCRLVYYAVCV